MSTNPELISSKATFSFHLDGDSAIDAELLSDTIKSMVELFKIANHDLDPDALLKMNITAFKNGSFQIDFLAACEAIKSLFFSRLPYASQLVTVVVGYFQLKQLLKGEPPKDVIDNKDGTVMVINNKGDGSITVNHTSVNILSNFETDEHVSGIARAVQKHNPEGGFSIATENGIVAFAQSDIPAITAKFTQNMKTSVFSARQTIDAVLDIRMPDLAGNQKWGFNYSGTRINAKIEDEDFLDKVHNGLSFRSGDYIHCQLEITTDLDDNQIPLVGEQPKYSVTKVYGDVQNRNKPQISIDELE